MTILLIGVTGAINFRILGEAVSRGHEVTAGVRNLRSLANRDQLMIVQVDAQETNSLRRLAAGHGAIVSSMSLGRWCGGRKLVYSGMTGLL